jgi:hypothetical protein
VGGDEVQQSGNDHVRRVRERIDERTAKHDAKVAER